MEKTGGSMGGSRLMQMQARFQKKQMQERELKIASLYEAQQTRALDRVRHSPSNASNGTNGVTSQVDAMERMELNIPHHPGKVRQMFEERRKAPKAGIDKSYPLQPIVNTDRTRKVTTITSKTTAASRAVEKKVEHGAVKTHSVRRQVVKTENIVNGSGDINHNREPETNAVKMLPHSNGEPLDVDEIDHDNNYLIENETFPDNLAPEPTPRSPVPKQPSPVLKQSAPVPKQPSPVRKQSSPEPKRPAKRSPATKPSPAPAVKPSPVPAVRKSTPVSPPRRAASDNTVSEDHKTRGGMQRPLATTIKRASQVSVSSSKSKPAVSRVTSRAVASPSSATSATTDGVPCAVCGRRFAPDRLEKHQSICKRTTTKKRKQFDALKHRLAGTEAEPFINKLRKQGTASQAKIKPLNNTWRQKHEDFINAIRAAKQVQAHLNAGGKLSDLPPPPPSENPDYVQCPHCQRRFNQAAAERHIPKCASYNFNKPKPGQGPAKRR